MIPKGWVKAGTEPTAYSVAIDTIQARKNHKSIQIRSLGNSTGFVVLMETIQASHYRSRRVRFSGYLRTQQVSGWAGLWMRIDGPDRKVLGFDNMKKRPVHGNTPWKKYSIIMDIPQKAQQISFGVLLNGDGQAWVNEIQFETVGKNVRVTSKSQRGVYYKYPPKPVNLNFAQ